MTNQKSNCKCNQSEMDESLITTKAIIDLNALAHNYNAIKAYCHDLDESAIVTAVVKANAYGIGMMKAARTFYKQGCRHFFVATLNEAMRLRRHMDDVEIYVLNGFVMDAFAHYQENRLIPCIGNVEAVKAWHHACAEYGVQLPTILHFDTGIHRLGMNVDEYLSLSDNIKSELNIHHIMSHFASADVIDDPQNIFQVENYKKVYQYFEGVDRSFGNSAGVSLEALQKIDLKGRNYLRPGIALYGAKPYDNYPIKLREVVKLSAKVLQILDLKAGDQMGYNHIYTCEKNMRALILSIGYADGLSRQISQTEDRKANYFSYQGKNLPIMGRVSMDMTAVDASLLEADEIKIGDEIEIFGHHIPLNDHAKMCNTISYEILCNMSHRVTKQYVDLIED